MKKRINHLREFKRLGKIADRHYALAKKAKRKGKNKRAEQLYSMASERYKAANAHQKWFRKCVFLESLLLLDKGRIQHEYTDRNQPQA